MTQPPLLHVDDTILWLKVALTVLTLGALYLRLFRADASTLAPPPLSLAARAVVLLVVLGSFGVFHNLGKFSGGTFVHYGEMFHYYLGPKYFEELGYYELYNAVIVADAEQDNALAGLPFFTDLRSYQNTQRSTALERADQLRSLFSAQRWAAFKADVAFFKSATGPHAAGVSRLLMDHGYNGSPLSTFLLGLLANAVPVSQLLLLSLLDVLVVLSMGGLVFLTFGFETGALFSVHFCINALNAHEFLSGSLLRYDFLLYIVAAVCLMERGRYAASAFFLTLSAMLRVFPAALFFGVAVAVVHNVRATRSLDAKYWRFLLAAVAAGVVLFLLPGATLGSVLEPWQDFAANTALHNRGVYVNHLGLRAVALFEPSHLSLERFVEAYGTSHPDIVRHWQDVKEFELSQKAPVLALATLVVLVGLGVIVWSKSDVERLLWPLWLVYAASFPAHYYYAFLSLLVLLFFRQPVSPRALVPLGLLLALNLGVLLTDAFRPSPIVFYTLVNLYLFVGLTAIVAFELLPRARKGRPVGGPDGPAPTPEAGREVKPRRAQRKHPSRPRRK